MTVIYYISNGTQHGIILINQRSPPPHVLVPCGGGGGVRGYGRVGMFGFFLSAMFHRNFCWKETVFNINILKIDKVNINP